MRASAHLTNAVHDELKDGFTGIGHFKRMFTSQVNEGSKPYQALPRHVAYILQMPFKEGLDLKNNKSLYPKVYMKYRSGATVFCWYPSPKEQSDYFST